MKIARFVLAVTAASAVIGAGASVAQAAPIAITVDDSTPPGSTTPGTTTGTGSAEMAPDLLKLLMTGSASGGGTTTPPTTTPQATTG